MKVIKKKIIGVLICMLMLATIPLAAGMVEEQEKDEQTNSNSLFGWTIIRGFIFNLKKEGNFLYFRAIRLHYTEITGTETAMGILRGPRCRISDLGPDRMFTFGPLGSFTWIFALSHGSLKELTKW